MGLFRKKPKTDQPDPVHAELASLEGRLVAAEQARAELEQQLRALGDANAQLTTQIATLDQANGQLDTRLATLDDGFSKLGEQIDFVAATNTGLNRQLSSMDELHERVRELTDRIGEPIHSTPTPPLTPPPAAASAPTPPPPSTESPPPPPPQVGNDDRIDEMAERLDQLAAAVAAHTEQMASARAQLAEVTELDAMLDAGRSEESDDLTSAADIATVRERLDALTEQLSATDGRVTAVATELANQLTELSSDIDELNRRTEPDEAGDADEVGTAELEARLSERLDTAIDDVLDTTERLAAEQARYEIQFRADLAELAERIRRPSS